MRSNVAGNELPSGHLAKQSISPNQTRRNFPELMVRRCLQRRSVSDDLSFILGGELLALVVNIFRHLRSNGWTELIGSLYDAINFEVQNKRTYRSISKNMKTSI